MHKHVGPRPADDAIDRAARALTDGEPSPRLRRVVLERIQAPRNPWALPVWVPATLAVALILIVARSLPSPWGEPDQARRANAQVTPAPATPEAPPPQTAARTPPDRGTERRTEPGTERIERRTERSERPERFERLERQGPIDIDPLSIAPLQLQELAAVTDSGVMPIEIDRLQLEPLQPQ